ncbi:cupredoxin domain-containing protein [Microlunatus antarcticus]|uniref:Putative lipoprotein n=1 Tax=Microlunatus antarcticus TaxID=53388 RepID=A0A7W5P6L8_9ACTN|nr:hypothetical protein [Microlunatus antarcticus]MBB3326573.1 putative lipoprotein [Microlunatus antarcticus]
MRVPLKAIAAPILLSALGVLLSGCGTSTTPADQPSSAGSAPPAASSSATTSPTTQPGTPAAGSPVAGAVVVSVKVSGGRVQPRLQTTPVKAGQTVTITATSDVADSIHVHGYDKTLDLPPGQTASVSFIADVKGVFEVETHETELLVAKLSVA